MQKIRQEFLNLTVNNALLGVLAITEGRPHHSDSQAWWERTHPWIVLNDKMLVQSEALGKLHQAQGVDPRKSPYFSLLQMQHRGRMAEGYELGRLVVLEELSPSIIYNGISNRNTLQWRGWSILVGEARESVDDYGCPCWRSEIFVSAPNESMTFDGIRKSVAREIYAAITGEDFCGDDQLGEDYPHPRE